MQVLLRLAHCLHIHNTHHPSQHLVIPPPSLLLPATLLLLITLLLLPLAFCMIPDNLQHHNLLHEMANIIEALADSLDDILMFAEL